MCTPKDDFGVNEILKAAYIVSCRCGHEACDLRKFSAEEVTRWQADPLPTVDGPGVGNDE